MKDIIITTAKLKSFIRIILLLWIVGFSMFFGACWNAMSILSNPEIEFYKDNADSWQSIYEIQKGVTADWKAAYGLCLRLNIEQRQREADEFEFRLKK